MHVYCCLQQPLLLQQQLSLAAAARGDTCPSLLPPLLLPYMDSCGCTAFDKVSLAFALAITNQYDWCLLLPLSLLTAVLLLTLIAVPLLLLLLVVVVIVLMLLAVLMLLLLL